MALWGKLVSQEIIENTVNDKSNTKENFYSFHGFLINRESFPKDGNNHCRSKIANFSFT